MAKKLTNNTLHVKPTTVSEISKQWRFTPPNRGMFDGTQPLFVRCNSKGVVNWDIAPVYTASELKGRKYKIII